MRTISRSTMEAVSRVRHERMGRELEGWNPEVNSRLDWTQACEELGIPVVFEWSVHNNPGQVMTECQDQMVGQPLACGDMLVTIHGTQFVVVKIGFDTEFMSADRRVAAVGESIDCEVNLLITRLSLTLASHFDLDN